MDLMPNVEIVEDIQEPLEETVEEIKVDVTEEVKVEEKDITIEEQISPEPKQDSPFVEVQIKKKKEKKDRKKKTKKIVDEILKDNETLVNLNESTYHQKQMEETRNMVRDCIRAEMTNPIEHTPIRRTRKSKVLTEKQQNHMIKMRNMRAVKKEERERLLLLEKELRELKGKKVADIESSSPPKALPKPKPQAPPTPAPSVPKPIPPPTNIVQRIVPKVYNPFDMYF
tara:strand:- start:192 stop:872 length:681 start_codon:yes stop_codon:yes gene_type:complete